MTRRAILTAALMSPLGKLLQNFTSRSEKILPSGDIEISAPIKGSLDLPCKVEATYKSSSNFVAEAASVGIFNSETKGSLIFRHTFASAAVRAGDSINLTWDLKIGADGTLPAKIFGNVLKFVIHRRRDG